MATITINNITPAGSQAANDIGAAAGADTGGKIRTLANVEDGADVTDEGNVTAIANNTAEVTDAPDHIWGLVGGALKRWTKAGFEAVVKALLPSAIEGGAATTTPADTDVVPGVKVDHSRLYYTWANIKAAIATAFSFSTTLPTANGKTVADEIGVATGATTALKLANLAAPASPTQRGVALLAADGGVTAGTVVQANDSRLGTQGVFTPTIIGSIVAGEQTYTIQNGFYYKNGNKIHVDITVGISRKGETISGELRIGGLPYSTKNAINYLCGGALNQYTGLTLSGGYGQVFVGCVANSNTIKFYKCNSGLSAAVVNVTELGSSSVFVLSIDYISA